MNVAVVEELKLGGTCLHRGCIPTKAFLKSAEVFDTVKAAKEFGINVGGDITFDYATALERSLKVVDKQYKGLLYLFEKKHKIPVFMGRGRIIDRTTIGVTPKTAAPRSASRPSRSSSIPAHARARSKACRMTASR